MYLLKTDWIILISFYHFCRTAINSIYANDEENHTIISVKGENL